MFLGRYDRARDFIPVGGAEWAASALTLVDTLQGRVEVNPVEPFKSMTAAFLANRPAELDAAIAEAKRTQPRSDGEPFITLAIEAAACKRPADALEFLRVAVSLNACAVPADTLPLFASVRALPDYPAFRTTAMQCHDRFMAALRE